MGVKRRVRGERKRREERGREGKEREGGNGEGVRWHRNSSAQLNELHGEPLFIREPITRTEVRVLVQLHKKKCHYHITPLSSFQLNYQLWGAAIRTHT